jgi:hypothetical protein
MTANRPRNTAQPGLEMALIDGRPIEFQPHGFSRSIVVRIACRVVRHPDRALFTTIKN